jgi:hypothetical protein
VHYGGEGLFTALWIASSALNAPGDFVERGVNTGFINSATTQALHWGTKPV